MQISLPRPPPHYIFWLLLHLNFYQVLISSFYAKAPYLSRCLTERTTRGTHIEARSSFFSAVVREGRLDTLGCKSRFPDLAPPFTGVGGFLSLPPISPPPGRSVPGSIPGRQRFWPAGPSMYSLRLRREPGARPHGRPEVLAKLRFYVLPSSAAAVVLWLHRGPPWPSCN